MSQKELFSNSQDHETNFEDDYNEELVDDDESTVVSSNPQQLIYSRSTRNLTDDAATTVADDINHLAVHDSSHKRRHSNDRMLSLHLSQWNYNNNRVGLNRGIQSTEELILLLMRENESRPIYVPVNPEEISLNILELDFKLKGHDKKNVNLDKNAISKLFTVRTTTALNHLKSLQKRVDDTSSKVFITGDLNAGKSTFCNALLRRRIMPVDQLPCTNVFCEILEAREYTDTEEVHAIPLGVAPTVKEATDVYNIQDKSTYRVYPIGQLSDLVYRSDLYSLLKVYIKDDKRPAELSLLRNGTVDISLIDSPGLNMDSIQTTEVLSRQEEIDMVIFVVNSENQLTLSGQEFIQVASREKKLMFFVVNKFDQIRDKGRCKKLILDQIKKMSPETHKQANEFVHFVSSGSRPEPSGDSGPDDGDDDDNFDSNDPDFDKLETALRNFVLKKRMLSKLLPAKTYVTKLLGDIADIAKWNLTQYNSENGELNSELREMNPEIKSTNAQCQKLTDRADKIVEGTVGEVYEFTKHKINMALELSAQEFPEYEGLSNIYDYVLRARKFILDQIKESVETSEFKAKNDTAISVKIINDLGKSELGEEFMSDRKFKSDLMFTKKKHFSLKVLNVPFNATDLFSPTWEGFLGYLSWGLFGNRVADDVTVDAEDKNWYASLGLGHYSVTKYWTNPSLLFTSKIPALAVYSWGGARVITTVVFYGSRFFSWQALRRISSSLLLVGSILGTAYLIHDLPRALPINLSNKYRSKLQEIDYSHRNAKRVSDEVRDVLRFPSREIVKSCETVLGKKQAARRDIETKLHNNTLSLKFFKTLAERASTQVQVIEQINLDVD
ncbi:LANO_0E08130g1_1 [Lachancea nothofagi CBS 11611]|uniref:LANO_0E08130g1_1 n=1 Tax=Lachancea nothofagi CBS 11611 TaxID=1266666 RepID=A0A1G4JV60_9SACH|nr:LANO_0E08130g1_1 [Lachancea nothofagi CBS 11611]